MRPARERHAPTFMNDYEVSLLSALYGDEPEKGKLQGHIKFNGKWL
jgi:hypothetical protein